MNAIVQRNMGRTSKAFLEGEKLSWREAKKKRGQ